MASPLSDCDIVADAFPMLNVRRPDCCIGGSSSDRPSLLCNDAGRIRYLSTTLVNINITFPTALMQLSELEDLRIDRSGLYGELPDSFSNFTKLVNLDLSLNQLSGRIPKSIGTLQTLDTLVLEQNEFEGPIPSELGELVNVSTILTNNLLTGDIPVSFANLRNISILGFDRNRLSGKVPDFVIGLESLRDLRLQGNYLTGPIPSSWRWRTSLDSNCIEESDDTESNLEGIYFYLQRQRLPAECLAFYGTTSQLPATSQPPTSTAASLPLVPNPPTTVNTTVLAASIATSLSSPPTSTNRRRSTKKRWWRVVLHLMICKSEMDRLQRLEGVQRLMGKSNGSVASVGRSGTVATSDPEDWSRKEVISWLAKCGFRPAVIEVTEDRLIDMGI
ncbi:hypothetical protein BC829DRAFT_402941 [Chytridium lagenaria]|nr:hypothetical protein BC829DRAFT_402941 [Chytridium lagenaria]